MKSLFFRSRPLSTIFVAFMASLFAVPAKAISIEDAENLAKKIGLPVKPLVFAGDSSWGEIAGHGKDCSHFVDTEDDSISMDIENQTLALYRFEWTSEAVKSQTLELSQDDARKAARNFLASCRTDSNELIEDDVEYYDRKMAGKIFFFRFILKRQGILLPQTANVSVSASTGRVVHYVQFSSPVLIKLTPIVTKDGAATIAGKRFPQATGWTLEDPNLAVTGPTTGQSLVWRLRFKSEDKTGTMVVIIDSQDGEVINSTLLSSGLPRKQGSVTRPTRYTFQKYWPLWNGNEDFVSGSIEKINGVNADHHSGIVLSGAAQNDLWLTFPAIVDELSYVRDRRVAFKLWNQIYVLDIKQGKIGQLNDGARSRLQMPSWDSGGHWLAMSGSTPPLYFKKLLEDDIYVAKVGERLSRVSMEQHFCVVQLPGRDIYPVYSPDDKWIVFAHEEQPDAKMPDAACTWSLYRVRPDKAYDAAGYQQPEKIIGGLMEPERLSWFPDGKRVLVSYADNEEQLKNVPEIIDVDNKVRGPLGWPELKDADLPDGKSLVVRELTVRPDGKRVAFAALRWSGDPKDAGAVCIYSANVDGTNLKRETPPAARPMEILKYPEEGVTALNAWEKLEPKRNEGRAWSRELQEKEHREKVEGARKAIEHGRKK